MRFGEVWWQQKVHVEVGSVDWSIKWWLRLWLWRQISWVWIPVALVPLSIKWKCWKLSDVMSSPCKPLRPGPSPWQCSMLAALISFCDDVFVCSPPARLWTPWGASRMSSSSFCPLTWVLLNEWTIGPIWVLFVFTLSQPQLTSPSLKVMWKLVGFFVFFFPVRKWLHFWNYFVLSIDRTYNSNGSWIAAPLCQQQQFQKLRVKRGIWGLLLFRRYSKCLSRTKWLNIKFALKEQHQG